MRRLARLPRSHDDLPEQKYSGGIQQQMVAYCTQEPQSLLGAMPTSQNSVPLTNDPGRHTICNAVIANIANNNCPRSNQTIPANRNVIFDNSSYADEAKFVNFHATPQCYSWSQLSRVLNLAVVIDRSACVYNHVVADH